MTRRNCRPMANYEQELYTGDVTRIILLGVTGGGKSSLGNALLNDQLFTAKTAFGSVTKDCRRGHRQIDGRHLIVVDTPGFLDTNVNESNQRKLSQEIGRSLQITIPGPHAFLIVLPCNRILQVVEAAWMSIEDIFPGVPFQYSIIIFTHLDQLQADGISEESFMGEEMPSSISRLLEKCNNRYIFFNTRLRNAEQAPYIEQLMTMITKMMKENGNLPFTNSTVVKIREAVHEAQQAGNYIPYKEDGSIDLLPQTEKIVVEAFLRRPQPKK